MTTNKVPESWIQTQIAGLRALADGLEQKKLELELLNINSETSFTLGGSIFRKVYTINARVVENIE